MSWYLAACVVLVAMIAGLAWMLVRFQQRQFTPAAAGGGRPAPVRPTGGDGEDQAGPPRLAGPMAFLRQRPARAKAPVAAPSFGADVPVPAGPVAASGGLARTITAALASTARVEPRNSNETEALAALRRAAAQAERGRFAAEVRAVIEALPGVQSWHDIRKLSAGGPTIDHLAVGPRGVFVIDPVVRPGRLTCRGSEVFAGQGYTPTPDPMIDEVLAKVAVVAPLVAPVPVQALIVLDDAALAVPPEVRAAGFELRGVRFTTRSDLAARLTTGLPLAEAVHVDAIWARLFPAFGPALDVPDHPFRGQPRSLGA